MGTKTNKKASRKRATVKTVWEEVEEAMRETERDPEALAALSAALKDWNPDDSKIIPMVDLF